MAYWAYENWVANGHRVTVHVDICSFCNCGNGVHGGGRTANGEWHGPYENYDAARDAVAKVDVAIRNCLKCSPR